MALPKPEPGLIIRYDYLWSREAASGRDIGKERPACLVAADPSVESRFIVVVPITRAEPTAEVVGVAIPPKIRRTLGLDDEPRWVILSEYNADAWPSAGLAPISGRPGVYACGYIPPRLFASIKTRFLELVEKGRSDRVRR